MLTNEASSMSRQATLLDTPNVISSPESADGPMHSGSPDGPTSAPSGPAPVRARPSARREGNDAQIALIGVWDSLQASIQSSKSLAVHRADGATSEIYGLSSAGSSKAHSLSESLASRLRARLDVNGSPEYALIWKLWDMPAQPSICALRASARPISDSGSTGWPTATRQDAGGSRSLGYGGQRFMTLTDAARMTGWPSPNTPSGGPNSRKTASHRGGMDLEGAAKFAGWATPTGRDHKDGESTLENTPINSLLGRLVSLSVASTENRGALNPAFSRWLMGFPPEWDDCAATATRSSRKSRRNLSKPVGSAGHA
jgi:hypothetical protein